MNKEKKFVRGKAILRQKAEELAEKRSQKNESQLSEADIQKLIHELEVHQVELELQNEELGLALSAARDAIKLYDFEPSGYFTLSGEGEILKLNLAASQMLGQARSSLLNTNLGFFVSNDTKPIFNQFLTEVLKSNEKKTCELVLLSENEPMFVHLSGIAVDNGEQCLITAVDFTERKLAEAALGQSEDLLSLFLKYSPIYAFIKDVTSTESRVIKASENYVEMIRIRGSEMAGKNMEELFPEEFAAKITADDWAVVSKGEVLKVDEELNGGYYTTIKYPITQGERKLLAGYTIDMTESRELEKALKKSEYEFRMLAEAMPQIVWVTRPDGWNVYFNQQWVNYTGQSLEESYGHGWIKPFHPEDQQRAWDAWQSATRKGTTYSLESRLRRADGVYNWWLIRGVPVLDENGNILKWFGTCTDINELKCIEANLRDSEHRYRLLIENANEGILVAQGPQLKFVNPMMVKISGFTEEELITLPFMDFIHQDDKELVLKNYTNRLKGGHVDDRYQFRLIRKDTSVKWVEICGVRIEWEGKPATLNFLTDITERKLAEEALQENEIKYRGLVENLPDAIAVYVEGKIVWVNNESLRMLGATSAEELIGKPVIQFVHPDSRSIVIRRMKEIASRGGILQSTEEKFIRLDGSTVEVDVKAMAIKFDGKPAVQLIIREITERKLAEEALLKSNRLYDNLVSNIPVGVYVLHSKPDASFTLDYVSSRMAEMLNISIEDQLADATLVFQKIHPDDQDSFIKLNLECIKFPHPFEWKGRFLVDGKVKFLHFRSSPEILDDGDILWHGLIVDITERVKTDEEIRLKNEELSKLVAEKDKFFSLIAHDLRSPFNVFLGFTQMLDEGVSTMERAKIQKIVSLLRNTALDVFDLLENLLEWSRIERGITNFEPHSILLLPQLKESLQSVYESANKKGIDISIVIPDDMKVFADKYMLGSILRNLASNAVKFTPKFGSIIISASVPTNNSVEITVKDSGIGMDEDMIGKLFFLNEQISRKGTEGESSSGLGLFICKDFVEKHGGQIHVESTVGKGSTFCFILPSENSGIN